MAVFRCRECGITVSKDVIELQDRGLMDETLPSYRIRNAYDGEDLVPEGFFLKAEGEDSHNFFDGRDRCFCLNLDDTVNTELDYENFVGCCGPDGSGGPNTECVNGHKIGTRRADCWTKHVLYLDSEKVEFVENGDKENFEALNSEELLEILENGSSQDRKRAVFLLAVRGEENANSVIEDVISKTDDSDLILTLLKAYRRIDGPSRDYLNLASRQLEDSESEDIREFVAVSLEGLNEEDLRDDLLSVLENEESEEVRRAVSETLASYSSEMVIGDLQDILESKKDPAVKASAAHALSGIDEDKSTEILIDNLDQDSVDVRRAVTSALRFKDGEEKFLPLVQMLDDSDHRVRRNAMSGLTDVFNAAGRDPDIPDKEKEEALPQLIESLKDETGNLRLNAAVVIGHLGDEETVEQLEDLKKDAENKKYLEALDKAIEKIKEDDESYDYRPNEQDLGLIDTTILRSADAVENESRNIFVRVFSFLIMILALGLSYLIGYVNRFLRKF